MKKILLNLKSSTWFIPAAYSFSAAILAITLTLIETRFYSFVEENIPVAILVDIDTAKNIFSVLTSSLLTMTTITFSTIMIVLTTYTSQFSPRTLEDFITDKKTLQVLGIFMGGFIYSIICLLLIQQNTEGTLSFTASVGVTIAITCITVFAFFIHHVSTSIQVNRLIDNLGKETSYLIEKTKEQLNFGEFRREKLFTEKEITLSHGEWKEVSPSLNGFIQTIDYKEIYKLAVDRDFVIRIDEKIGSYIYEDKSFLSYYLRHSDEKIDEEEIKNKFTIGGKRNKFQDIEYNMQKIVEIAVRALSPGINDPNTAIRCIYKLGQLLAQISQDDYFNNLCYYDEKNNLRLCIVNNTVKNLLYKSFYQIRYYGFGDVSILGSTIDALKIIASKSNKDNIEEIKEFKKYIVNEIDWESLGSLDNEYLENKLQELENIIP